MDTLLLSLAYKAVLTGLSGLLFIIGIELFARALKKDQLIKRINVETKEIKITQCVVDTTVFLRDEEPVEQLLRLLDELKLISGLEINTSKIKAMWLGRWRDRTHTPFNSKWPKEPICALGIYFSYNTEHSNKLHFEEKINIKREKTLNGWKRRKLTLLGRIKIINTFGLSKLIYNASVLSSVQNNKLDFDSFLSRLRTKRNTLREVSLENKTFNNF